MASINKKEDKNTMNDTETLDLFGSLPEVSGVQNKEKQRQQTAQDVLETSTAEYKEAKKERVVDLKQPIKTLDLKKEEPRSSRRKGPSKSDGAFKTISEVATQLNIPQHVLRFWETKFSQIKPMKRGGGRRYYRPRDVEIVTRIQELLHHEGYTIKGVQKLIRKQPLVEFLQEEQGGSEQRVPVKTVPVTVTEKDNIKEPLSVILEGLKAIRQELNA